MYGARDADKYADAIGSSTTEEVSLGKFSADVFESLMAMKTTLELSKTMPPPQPAAQASEADDDDDTAATIVPRLGEAVCPDASVQPSEGCYDDAGGGVCGSSNAWLEGEEQAMAATAGVGTMPSMYSSIISQPSATGGVDDVAMDLE